MIVINKEHLGEMSVIRFAIHANRDIQERLRSGSIVMHPTYFVGQDKQAKHTFSTEKKNRQRIEWVRSNDDTKAGKNDLQAGAANSPPSQSGKRDSLV